MKNSIRYILFAILGFILISCTKSKPLTNEATKQKIETPNFDEYFGQKEIIDSWKYYHYIYSINEQLRWNNIIDTTVNLEIRVYISVSWKPTEIYRLLYKDSFGWKGYLTTLLFNKIEKQAEPFIPFMGWEKFEEALLVSDIKNINATKSDLDIEPHSVNPTYVSIQLLMPTSSMIIPLGTYFSFSEDYPNLKGVAAMDTLMHSLLDPTIYIDKYYP